MALPEVRVSTVEAASRRWLSFGSAVCAQRVERPSMIRFFAAFALAMAIASSANADQDQVWTLTNWDCADWTKAHSVEDKRVIAALEHYIVGYLSGRAVALGSNYLKGVDVGTVAKEVGRQCDFRPSASLAEIALVVAHQLEGR